MTRLLASVANLEEARVAEDCGAGIIDLKNPRKGALGAWSVVQVRKAVDALQGKSPISATIGDLPMVAETIRAAVEPMAATGVDYVKLGFFSGGDWHEVIAALKPITQQGIRLVAVMFADHHIDALGWIPRLAEAGFAGAMLDTANKQKGTLTTLRNLAFLSHFVSEAQQAGLLCGLAGSLREQDIHCLQALGPDYLGFRGALCGGTRTDALDPHAVRTLLNTLSTTRGQPPEFAPWDLHHALQPHSSGPFPA
jgi:uncharacterized protein (UPF0264 family)